MKNIKRNGFSLVSVMVATGLLGLLAMGMMKMNELQMKHSKTAEVNNEIVTLHSRINQYLLDSDACGNTINALSLTGASKVVTAIKDKNNNDIFLSGSIYGNNTVKITSMSLTPKTTANLSMASVNEKNTILTIKYKKMSKLTARNTLTKQIGIRIQKDLNGNIYCYSQLKNAVETAKKDVCTSLGGIYDSTLGKCTSISVSGDITSTGNIVTGSTGTCNVDKAGALKYNSTSKKMEFCNGSVWASIYTSPTSGSQAFTTAGTHSFTVPNGIKFLQLKVIGGGGGAGGGHGACETSYLGGLAGQPGGDGSIVNTMIIVNSGQTYTITIGDGGSHGSVPVPWSGSQPTNGTNGGSSSAFGIVAPGGSGGGTIVVTCGNGGSVAALLNPLSGAVGAGGSGGGMSYGNAGVGQKGTAGGVYISW